MKPEHLEALRDARRRRAGSRDRRRRLLDRRLPRRPRREGDDAGRVPRPHPRGRALPALRRARSSASSSAAARPTSARAARCGCAAARAVPTPSGPSFNVGSVMAGTTVKTEAVVLRSIRYGEADRILHLYSTTRGRIGAIAKGARKPQSRFGGRLEPFFRLDLVLHEGRGELLTVTSVATVDGYPRLRSSGPALDAGARACDAVLRLLDSAEPNPPAYNLLCRYLALLDDPGEPRGGRARDGALLPAEAGAGRRLRARARLLRALRRGRAPGRLLRRRRRRRLRQLRGGLLPALRGGAPLHGRGAGEAAGRGAARPSRWRCARSSGRSARRSSTTRTCSCAPPPRSGGLAEHGALASSAPYDRRARHRHLRGPGPRLGGRVPRPSRRPAPTRRERAVEEADSPLRTPFQRDRDRIVHSKAFRRLKHKTQVFVAPEGDHYRTRLTHTLEACGIARTVARALGLNEDLTEAIGLGHDLGHPPFGHAGEEALDAALRERCGSGFKHNEHSLRVVDVLERDGRGPQPDRAGPRRHPQPHRLEQAGDAGGADRQAGRPRRLHQPRHRRRPAGRDPAPEDLPAAEIELLGPTGSARIDTLVRDIVEHSRGGRRHRPERGDRRRDAAPAQVHVRPRLPRARRRAASTSGSQRTMRGLFDHYLEHPEEVPERRARRRATASASPTTSPG